MGNLSHDKGERAVIGRLAEVMDFNNQNYKIYPSWHNGIISVRIYADDVNPNDNDIAENIIKTKEDIATYLGNVQNIKLASLLTDHGGGSGTTESCADKIKRK